METNEEFIHIKLNDIPLHIKNELWEMEEKDDGFLYILTEVLKDMARLYFMDHGLYF